METALVALLDEIWCEWAEGSASIFALFDLSAFNTINHGCLLNQLRRLRVGSMVLCWFASILQGQFQLVLIVEDNSYSRPLLCEVP